MKWLVLSSVICLFSCAIAKHSEPLYGAYSSYATEANINTISTTYTNYFAPVLTDGKDIGKQEIKQQLLFHSYIAQEHSHAEIITPSLACLTVNGFDNENMPLALNMAYEVVKGEWLINAINVQFLDNKDDFSQAANCPSP